MAEMLSAKARDVLAAEVTNAAAAKVTHVTSCEASHLRPAKAAHAATKAADVPPAKTSHVSTAKASATVATAATASGLCTRYNQASSKHGACQNHQHSSGHDILLSVGIHPRDGAWPDAGLSVQPGSRRMKWR